MRKVSKIKFNFNIIQLNKFSPITSKIPKFTKMFINKSVKIIFFSSIYQKISIIIYIQLGITLLFTLYNSLKAMKSMNSINAASSNALKVNYRNNPDQYDQYQLQQLEKKKLKKQGLTHLYNQDYQPANYKKACQYRDSRSYKKKLPNGTYRELGLLDSTDQLKAFGLGPYFFIQFYRRISWFLLVASIFSAILIYLNWAGNGLGDYTISFSTYLIQASIGNYSGSVLTPQDGYIVTIIPFLIYVGLTIFYFKWKYDYFKQISLEDQDNDRIRPEKFCVQVNGFQDKVYDQDALQNFYSLYGPVYEVSFVRRYGNKLSYFEDLDNLNERIKEEELEIILGSGDNQYCNSLKKQRNELEKWLNTIRINPQLLSAYIHFQFEKSKVDMLNWHSDNYLFDTCSHSCVRFFCCCCFSRLPQQHVFQGNILKIHNDRVPDPQDINWDYYQLSLISKICRYICAFAVILVFIIVSCTVIGLCSVYISGNSINCDGITIPSSVTVAQASTDSQVKLCFCSSNLYSSINNSQISSYCGDLVSKLYIQQGIQWVVVIISSLTNFIFGMVVHLIVNFVRPASLSSGLLTKTVLYTSFMIFNTVILPILLYANIFGFKATSYVSFITIVSSDAYDFFNVSSISLSPDFEPIWYRNVSPIFTNYIVLDIPFTWVFFLYYKFVSSKSGLKSQEGKILQKHMNQQITKFQYNVYSEHSYFNLILVIGVVFSAGLPVLWPLTFLSLFSKYVTMRNIFQNNSSKIEGLGENYVSLQLILLPALIFCSCIFGCWMLTGNSDIYPNILPMAIPVNITQVINRELYLPFYMILAGIILIYFFFYNTIIRFCMWLTSLCYQTKTAAHPYHTLTFAEYAKKMNVLTSYNIRNNDKYKNAMLKLYQHLEDQKI